MAGLAAPAETGFELGSYLQERTEKPDLIMVEFGHGPVPVAHQQPFNFDGQRAYIGVENWMRDPLSESREAIEEIREDRDGSDNPNVFFITRQLDGEVHREFDEESSYSWYEGPYAASTHLPDGAAHEFFASNVFSDPLIAFNDERMSSLLREGTRVTDDEGILILREVITPTYAKDMLAPEYLAAFGLKVALMQRKVLDRKTWQEL